jgi:hypothetical protein
MTVESLDSSLTLRMTFLLDELYKLDEFDASFISNPELLDF